MVNGAGSSSPGAFQTFAALNTSDRCRTKPLATTYDPKTVDIAGDRND
ncbi:hypothetical protein PMES_03249 [Profundibacterium mesophilum KAUST100406-0324]|uniref:Uncharacterized protein n=1 Tax=Profundibacterium mesophilum KAUST100406-0324 TaxID=1037889 RepID=A0A921NN34_9RHOB|nr:hypothetical protein PMES_03249 [Profundibacterium mesophilum KAUST100406-0324]